MKYKATYYNKGFPICTTVVNADNAYDAEIIAGFKIVCMLSNVEHDHIKIEELQEV